ncbi:MAG: metal-sulfur cluster assembly factor [Adhaeribacter sp.]
METPVDFPEKIFGLLKQVIDPEIGINIVDLGLVYEVALGQDNTLTIQMTLTTPGCPMGQTIQMAVVNVLERNLPGYKIMVEIVWTPMWEPDRISEDGQRQLNGGFKRPERHHGESFWDRYF